MSKARVQDVTGKEKVEKKECSKKRERKKNRETRARKMHEEEREEAEIVVLLRVCSFVRKIRRKNEQNEWSGNKRPQREASRLPWYCILGAKAGGKNTEKEKLLAPQFLEHLAQDNTFTS